MFRPDLQDALRDRDAVLRSFLSPDGMTAFFNSDESGTLQAYMIRNLPDVGGVSPEEVT